MRGLMICAWLLVPAVVGAYHFGPGQEQLVIDNAGAWMRKADAHAKAGHYANAVDAYDRAIASLPTERVSTIRRARIERSKAQLHNSQLPEAYDDLTLLMEELNEDASPDPELLRDARTSLASAQYFLTWLMRLEGEPRDAWEPEIEAARQNYRLLAETATDSKVSEERGKDLEAAIRLARMDLSDLQALPLPSQCKSCCSGNCQCKCKNRGKNKAKPQNKSEDARGASSGPPPDGRGS